MKKLLTDSVFYGLIALITSSVGFVVLPLLSTLLTPTEFARYDLSITVVILFGGILNFGQSNAFQKYYFDSDYQSAQKDLFATGLVIITSVSLFYILVISAILLILYNIFPNMLNMLNLTIIIIALYLAPFLQIANYITDVFRNTFQKLYFAILTFSLKIGNVVLTLVLLIFTTAEVDAMIYAYFLASFVTIILGIYLVRHNDIEFMFKFIRPNFSLIWEFIRFGYPFITVGISVWIFTTTDRWMLVYFSSMEEVGIYSMSIRLSMILAFLVSSFSTAWSPIAFSIVNDTRLDQGIIFGKILNITVAFMLIVVIIFVSVSEHVIKILFDVGFHAAYETTNILAAGMVPLVLQQITAFGITLSGKTFYFQRLTILAACLNLLLNYFLIPSYGAIGAAWSTSATSLFLALSYLLISQREHPIQLYKKHLSIYIFAATLLVLHLLLKATENYPKMINENFIFINTILVIILLTNILKNVKGIKIV